MFLLNGIGNSKIHTGIHSLEFCTNGHAEKLCFSAEISSNKSGMRSMDWQQAYSEIMR